MGTQIASASTTIPAPRQDPARSEAATCEDAMSLVRLLGFTTLTCGCVVGRYRELATSREVSYVEEKGKGCSSHGHRRNHTVPYSGLAAPVSLNKAS